MQNLSFVGLSDDGAALVLSGGDGSRYRLAIDERLRSATRGGRSQMDVSQIPVSAREIQARLRAGATPTEVAEFSGWTVNRVEAFAAPILQERGWVAQRAQACAIGRGEDDPSLGDLVRRRLAERGIDGDTARWDSWRRDDSRWTVLLAYPAGKGDRVATWTFDMEAGTLAPEDDEARWFTEQPPAEEPRPRLVTFPTDERPGGESRRPEPGTHPAGRSGGPGQSNHPAGRAQPHRQAPATPPVPPREPSPPEPERPRWDEVLFGSPRDDR